MSYFVHTKRDLADARREIGEALLALADDTARKMNGEMPGDPNAEREYDSGYLLEDLLTRLSMIAEEAGADPNLFESAADMRRPRLAYDLLDQEPHERVEFSEVGHEVTRDLGGFMSGVATYRSSNASAGTGEVARREATRVEEGDEA